MINNLSNNPVYDLCLSYQKTAALQAAIQLDIFTTIGDQSSGADDIAKRSGASARGIRILCDFLCVIGLLKKESNLYFLSADAKRLLDRKSPYCLADIIDFYAAPEVVSRVMTDPSGYVRAGGAAGMANVSPDNPVWVRFAQAMVPFASVTAKRTAAYIARRAMNPRRILDVAAGHGLYGIEAAATVQEAVVTAMDWASVLDVAKRNAASAGVADRYRTITGNVFEIDWGENYDLILLPNILHHFDRPGCVQLLGRAKKSLNPGGSVFVIDMMPNPDRVSPAEQAAFAFIMLATTPQGDAYTCDDYEAMAKETGLVLVESRALPPTPQTLMVFGL
ncbi:MAG: class I SAM-dependent methyltransferase [Smithellaceae bacterium]